MSTRTTFSLPRFSCAFPGNPLHRFVTSNRLSGLITATAAGAAFVLSGCGGSGGGSQQSATPFSGVHRVQVIATFDGGSSGSHPKGVLAIDSAGNLYGATGSGGTNGYGTIFELEAGKSTVKKLADLSDYGTLSSLVIDNNGNVFGVLQSGDHPYSATTIFKVAKGSGQLSVIANYPYMGYEPTVRIAVDSGGNLYGTLKKLPQDGTVFEVPAGSLTMTTLATLSDIAPDQLISPVIVLDADGNLYGTTYIKNGFDNPASFGTLWEISGKTKTWTTLVNFTSAVNGLPTEGLIIDSSGNLYGTTQGGNSTVHGTIYELPRQGSGYGALTTIVTFQNFPVLTPTPQLAIDKSGNLFGTARETSNNTTVYEVAYGSSTATSLTHSQSLQSTYGGLTGPNSPLIVDGAGDVFDTTGSGSFNANNLSGVTVLEVAKGNAYVTELGIDSIALSANSYLVQGRNDVIYGTSANNAANANGCIYALLPPEASDRSASRFVAR